MKKVWLLDHQDRTLVGEYETFKECNEAINKKIESMGFDHRYDRYWYEHDLVVIDFGSWTKFFEVEGAGSMEEYFNAITSNEENT